VCGVRIHLVFRVYLVFCMYIWLPALYQVWVGFEANMSSGALCTGIGFINTLLLNLSVRCEGELVTTLFCSRGLSCWFLE